MESETNESLSISRGEQFRVGTWQWLARIQATSAQRTADHSQHDILDPGQSFLIAHVGSWHASA